MNRRQLAGHFSDAELSDLLLDAVYKECVFNKPEILVEVLKNHSEPPTPEEFNGFIGFEKMRIVAEFASSVGAGLGVIDADGSARVLGGDMIGEPAGTC